MRLTYVVNQHTLTNPLSPALDHRKTNQIDEVPKQTAERHNTPTTTIQCGPQSVYTDWAQRPIAHKGRPMLGKSEGLPHYTHIYIYGRESGGAVKDAKRVSEAQTTTALVV